MRWTSPRTWCTGERVDSDMMNEHIRDNLTFLKEEQEKMAQAPKGFWAGVFGFFGACTAAKGKVSRRRLLFPWRS